MWKTVSVRTVTVCAHCVRRAYPAGKYAQSAWEGIVNVRKKNALKTLLSFLFQGTPRRLGKDPMESVLLHYPQPPSLSTRSHNTSPSSPWANLVHPSHPPFDGNHPAVQLFFLCKKQLDMYNRRSVSGPRDHVWLRDPATWDANTVRTPFGRWSRLQREMPQKQRKVPRIAIPWTYGCYLHFRCHPSLRTRGLFYFGRASDFGLCFVDCRCRRSVFLGLLCFLVYFVSFSEYCSKGRFSKARAKWWHNYWSPHWHTPLSHASV